METKKTKQEIREDIIARNELTKTCKKEQAKLRKQLIKLGIYYNYKK